MQNAIMPKNRNLKFGNCLDQLIKASLLAVKTPEWELLKKTTPKIVIKMAQPVEIFEGHGFALVQNCTIFKVHPSSIHELLSFTNQGETQAAPVATDAQR